MIRKTVLLAGVTAAFLTAAPALAQDAPAPAPAAEAQAQGSLQLQPGSSVKGSDGSVLGALEGVQTNAAGEQELTVRGSDGALRGVALGGLRQEGSDVVVGVTSAEFATSPVVEESAPAPADGVPAAGDNPATSPDTTASTQPETPTDASQPDGATPPTPQA